MASTQLVLQSELGSTEFRGSRHEGTTGITPTRERPGYFAPTWRSRPCSVLPATTWASGTSDLSETARSAIRHVSGQNGWCTPTLLQIWKGSSPTGTAVGSRAARRTAATLLHAVLEGAPRRPTLPLVFESWHTSTNYERFGSSKLRTHRGREWRSEKFVREPAARAIPIWEPAANREMRTIEAFRRLKLTLHSGSTIGMSFGGGKTFTHWQGTLPDHRAASTKSTAPRLDDDHRSDYLHGASTTTRSYNHHGAENDHVRLHSLPTPPRPIPT